MAAIKVVGGIKTEPEEVLIQLVKEEDSNIVEINAQDIHGEIEEETQEKLKDDDVVNNDPVKIKAGNVKIELSKDTGESTDCVYLEDKSNNNESQKSNKIEVLHVGQRHVLYQRLIRKPDEEMVLLNYSDNLRNRRRQHQKAQEIQNRLFGQVPVDKETVKTLQNNEVFERKEEKNTVLPDKEYQCNHCPFVNTNKKEMATHIQDNHKNTTLAFPNICVDRGTEKTLQNNEVSERNEKKYTVLPDNQYQCNHCKFVNTNKKKMATHIRHNHKNTMLAFPSLYVKKKTVETLQDNEVFERIEDEYTMLPDKQYQCNHCQFVNPNRRKMRTHIRHKHKDNTLDFPDIYVERLKRLRMISTCSRYIAWVEYKPENDDQYRCNHCQIVIRGVNEMEKHIMNNHRQVKMRQCPHCPYQSRFDLTTHIVSLHTDEKEIKYYRCDSCDYKSKLKNGLRRHIRNQHIQPEKLFRCPICDKMFKQPKYLSEHVRRIHEGGDVEKVKCFHCSYECISKEGLAHHIQSFHMDIESLETFQCQLCNFKTKFKMHLQAHTSNYHRQECICHVCSYTCRTKLQLRLHLMTHRKLEEKDLKYRCDQCDYKTYRYYSLTVHKLKHKKPEEIEYFYCYHCDFKAKRKDNLKSHIYRHEKKKEIEYDCYICEFKTIKKDVLIRHINKHSKEATNDLIILKTEEIVPELDLSDEKEKSNKNKVSKCAKTRKIKSKK